MIKSVLKRPGKAPLVLLGLSRRNVELLMEGKPISVNGMELGLNADIAIHFGETEDEMRDEMFDILGQPRTHIDRRR